MSNVMKKKHPVSIENLLRANLLDDGTTINPITKRKIKFNGRVAKKLIEDSKKVKYQIKQ